MKKIVWFSRHEPLPAQLEELERIFGSVEVIQDPNPFSGAEDVVRRFIDAGADEMVVVAPLTVVERLCRLGIRPLMAQMEQIQGPITDPSREVAASGRFYRFVGFKRVKDVVIVAEEL